jgi:SET domain-containing protein
MRSEETHMESCNLVIRETEKGQAVFAGRDIKAGESVCEFTGPLVTMAEYLELHDPGNNHYVQIDDDLFMGPSGGADDLINHSCNPNGGLVYRDGTVKFVAIRDIRAGEELSFDYSTTMNEDCWEMECLCGDPACRITVRDFKYLPDDLQNRYLSLGVVMPYIARKHRASRA